MRLISELAAVKCQGGKEESNRARQLTFGGAGEGDRLAYLLGFSRSLPGFIHQPLEDADNSSGGGRRG